MRSTQSAGAAALAATAADPVAALISVPVQFNYDRQIGPDRAGDQWLINVQPVIPFTLNEDWNLISRTIVPILVQDDILLGSGSQSGLGDIVQSLFFSPRKPTQGGWTWGAGPVFLLPTATNDLMGTKKWGAGPTAVALRQEHGWSYGALANHISESPDNGPQGWGLRFGVAFLFAK